MLQRQLTPVRNGGSLSPPEELSGTNVLSQAARASASFPHKWFILATSNNLCSLGPTHIQHHSRCNTLHSLNTENKGYIYSWAHHRQGSGDCKSYSNVGSAIAPRDITCAFHTASMKHHDIKLTLARHDQSTNSSAPYEDFLQPIGSRFKQEESEIGGKIKCSQTWTSMNHHLESELALQHSKFSPGKQKKHHVNSLGPVTRKLRRNNKNPTRREKSLHTRNLTTMEECDWPDTLNNRRNDKPGVTGESIKPDGNYIVNSFHFQHSSLRKGLQVRWRQWKLYSILIGSTQQSMNQWCYLFWWKLYPGTWLQPFPLLSSPSDLPSSCLLLPSFLPAALWKHFFSWLKRSAGSSQTIKGQCEAVSPSRRRTSFVK